MSLHSFKFRPLLKRLKDPFKTSKVVAPVVIPQINFGLTEKITSLKIVPILARMKEHGHALTEKEQIKRISNFAITNKSPEIIEELLTFNIDVNQKVDYLESETMLAMIIQYPYYHDLFKKLIEAGANPYCQTQPGDVDFFSNALYRSVTYDEFLNIIYLVDKGFCSYQEALSACYLQNKVHLLTYLLEIFPYAEAMDFKDFVEKTPMSRQEIVLNIISQLKTA